MKLILRYTFDSRSISLLRTAHESGYGDIFEFSGEWYFPLERPYVPQLSDDNRYIFYLPNTEFGAVSFGARNIYDDVVNGVIYIDVTLVAIDNSFDALVEGLKRSWKRGHEELKALIEWASSP